MHAARDVAEPVAGSMETDDAALVVAAQAARQAFAPLYERYVTPIFRYCFHRLGDREGAEDATSQVFIKALAALPRYRADAGSFRSWLFAIAHNTVTDDVRRLRPAVSLHDRDLTSNQPGPEAETIAAQEWDELHRLLIELPAEQRRVMELRLSGLTSPEVARVLGRTPLAVRSLQFRAVSRLRAALGQDAIHVIAGEDHHGPH